jgi:hypothetical protein
MQPRSKGYVRVNLTVEIDVFALTEFRLYQKYIADYYGPTLQNPLMKDMFVGDLLSF